ncbi:hypothetical protein PVAP13_2KG036332 [Panicum virgatum]|uniref:Uncharacterized protein n=1 Tax=Panicum virgatum TaxID=38727 RepID=A0A8T0VXS7_PANVG|nr:hypothetical protein PVAP13_2KG036332 [Panicum virgatum]
MARWMKLLLFMESDLESDKARLAHLLVPCICIKLFSDEHIGCDFGPYCSLRNQGRLPVWQAKR